MTIQATADFGGPQIMSRQAGHRVHQPLPAQAADSTSTSTCTTTSNSTSGTHTLHQAWADYHRQAALTLAPFEGRFRTGAFDYVQSERLQAAVPERFRKPYAIRVAYTAWGSPDLPLLVCLGGVANVARRFDYLGKLLSNRFHVVCMDWLGRGDSGWLHDASEYGLATYQAQLHQLLNHLGADSAALLGSSMGGSVALGYAAQRPHRVSRLILNDIGPAMPPGVRTRRAEVLARHYVFRSPQELLRRSGASQKNDGPINDSVRLHNVHVQTRWSEEEGGRVYRYDLRAMQAYQKVAAVALDQWHEWDALRCPVLVIHGTHSDVLVPPILDRMAQRPCVTLMHVPLTGHTPALADSNHLACIQDWLTGDEHDSDFSSLYSIED